MRDEDSEIVSMLLFEKDTCGLERLYILQHDDVWRFAKLLLRMF